jgi:hypothetical protein
MSKYHHKEDTDYSYLIYNSDTGKYQKHKPLIFML